MTVRKFSAYPAVGVPARRVDRGREPVEDWELVICGDLTDKQLDLTERLVSVPVRSRGTIFFDSCGGSAYAGLSLAALIRLRGLDVLAVVAGECSSAAILPFAACPRRCVIPHATLLFHPIRWQSDENLKLEEAEEWARHFKLLEQDLDELLSRMFGCDRTLLAQWTRPGRFVSGQELVDAGLAVAVDLFAGDVWSQVSGSSSRNSRPAGV